MLNLHKVTSRGLGRVRVENVLPETWSKDCRQIHEIKYKKLYGMFSS